MADLQLGQCLADAREAALRAWLLVRHFFRGTFAIHEKEGDGPATEADIMADRAILEFLRARYPEDRFGYLSEETAHGPERLQRGACWIIDPIDGTRDFIDGGKDFAVQIALAGPVREGGPFVPLVAVVYQPARRVLHSAIRGGGTFEETLGGGDGMPEVLERHRVHVSDMGDLDNCRSVVTRATVGAKLQAVIDHLGIPEISNRGSFGVKVSEVATGRADLYLNTAHRRCKEWDVCAPELILTEAGGMLTDLSGATIAYNKEDVYVSFGALASNAILHPPAMAKLLQIEGVWRR